MAKRIFSLVIVCGLGLAALGYFYVTNYGLPKTAAAKTETASHISMYFYDNKDFFPQSAATFSQVKPLTPPPHIFIVNQHILAAHLIAQQFALATNPAITTVVLLTQNNWDAGEGPIITSREGWQTPLGNIAPNFTLADKLINAGVADQEEEIFTHEHGITGIVPYVAHSFPNAQIVPLVIRDKTNTELLDSLASQLDQLDLSKTVIVASIDMSHYLPKYVADVHDQKTIETIQHFDYSIIPQLDIDTAPTLYTIMKVAEHAGEQQFVVTGHTNSTDIVGDPSILSTTSYITGYFAPGGITQTPSPIHALFVGDLMFDRAVAAHAKAQGTQALFSQIERLFLGNDMVVGNLEGTITTNASIAAKTPSILRFTFDPSYAAFLKGLHFTAVSQANNHALDFGPAGFAQTAQYLQAAGLVSFGSPLNNQNLATTLEVEGKKICLVGYHQLFNPDPTTVINKIKDLRPQCDRVVVVPHWGVEYLVGKTPSQEKLAHQFIDAGADLIIGGHPHVIEPLEIYKGKAIFYSLGNFIFDQDFSYATTHGLAIQVEFGATSTAFTLVPVKIDHEEVTFPTTADREKALSPLINPQLPAAINSAIMKTSSFTI